MPTYRITLDRTEAAALRRIAARMDRTVEDLIETAATDALAEYQRREAEQIEID